MQLDNAYEISRFKMRGKGGSVSVPAYYPMKDPNNWVEYGNMFTYYKPESNPHSGNFYRCTLKNKPNWPTDLCIRFNLGKGGFQISRLCNDAVNNKAYYPPILFGDGIPDTPPEPTITTQVLYF